MKDFDNIKNRFVEKTKKYNKLNLIIYLQNKMEFNKKKNLKIDNCVNKLKRIFKCI